MEYVTLNRVSDDILLGTAVVRSGVENKTDNIKSHRLLFQYLYVIGVTLSEAINIDLCNGARNANFTHLFS